MIHKFILNDEVIAEKNLTITVAKNSTVILDKKYYIVEHVTYNFDNNTIGIFLKCIKQ